MTSLALQLPLAAAHLMGQAVAQARLLLALLLGRLLPPQLATALQTSWHSGWLRAGAGLTAAPQAAGCRPVVAAVGRGRRPDQIAAIYCNMKLRLQLQKRRPHGITGLQACWLLNKGACLPLTGPSAGHSSPGALAAGALKLLGALPQPAALLLLLAGAAAELRRPAAAMSNLRAAAASRCCSNCFLAAAAAAAAVAAGLVLALLLLLAGRLGAALAARLTVVQASSPPSAVLLALGARGSVGAETRRLMTGAAAFGCALAACGLAGCALAGCCCLASGWRAGAGVGTPASSSSSSSSGLCCCCFCGFTSSASTSRPGTGGGGLFCNCWGRQERKQERGTVPSNRLGAAVRCTRGHSASDAAHAQHSMLRGQVPAPEHAGLGQFCGLRCTVRFCGTAGGGQALMQSETAQQSMNFDSS